MARGPGPVVPHLLPLRSVWCGSFKPGTADTSEGCFCEDKAGYVVKPNTADSPKASHNEWLSAHLAVRCDVPLLGFNIIETTSGELWFGSEWYPGEVRDWWNLAAGGAIQIDDLREDLSRIYAFDLFVNNGDRHSGNYIVRAEAGGHRVYAMDHGRSWQFGGFPPPAPPMAACNTTNFRDWMKAHFPGFPVVAPMKEVLYKLMSVPAADIERIVTNQPSNWLTIIESQGVIDWWNNGHAAARISEIDAGIDDGSLL